MRKNTFIVGLLLSISCLAGATQSQQMLALTDRVSGIWEAENHKVTKIRFVDESAIYSIPLNHPQAQSWIKLAKESMASKKLVRFWVSLDKGPVIQKLEWATP